MPDSAAAPAALRLGASPTLAHHVLTRLLADFGRRHPAVAVVLHPANSAQVARALLRGELDVGFVEGPERLPGLHYQRLLFDELVAVRGATPGGPPPTPLPLAEALACTWLLREPGSGTLAAVAAALLPHGVALADLPQACYLADNEAVKTRLRAGPGTLGFLSRRALVAELLGRQLEEVPIQGLYLARELMAAWRTIEELSPVVQQFMHECGVAC
jgi:DNA-binding transcriptional LysR family regulator